MLTLIPHVKSYTGMHANTYSTSEILYRSKNVSFNKEIQQKMFPLIMQLYLISEVHV